MLELRRTIRFCINSAAARDGCSDPRNSYAAWPAMRGLGRFYQLHVRCAGEADPVTGYFINIKDIDQAVREHVVPYFDRLLEADPRAANIGMGEVMRRVVNLLQPTLGGAVQEVCLELTPFYNLEMGRHDMDHVMIRQQYEYSAAHRLHTDELSDQENRRLFGKCNNPSGHGHNYRLEVAIRAPIDAQGRVLYVEQLDALVHEAVIEKLDHKHLNLDVPQFAGINPTVENIAMVIWQMLEPRVGELQVELAEVSVWETLKTVCTYRGKQTAGFKSA